MEVLHEDTDKDFKRLLATEDPISSTPRNTYGTLHASSYGIPCGRRLWYDYNDPGKASPLTPSDLLKFHIGHVLESHAIILSIQSGHVVRDRQRRVDIQVHGTEWRLVGHMDCVIDGTTVDVKTASPYSFRKMTKEGLDEDNDSFGYIGQLSFYDQYREGDHSGEDPRFLIVDKSNGHIDTHTIIPWTKEQIQATARNRSVELGTHSSHMVTKAYGDNENKAGNRTLPIICSFCPYKTDCWPGLRAFKYAWGTQYLTEVNRTPRVEEIEP